MTAVVARSTRRRDRGTRPKHQGSAMPHRAEQQEQPVVAVRLFQPANVEPLRPTNQLTPQMTLAALWQQHYKPIYLAARGVTPETLNEYQQSIDYWVRFTGDPPLESITDRDTLAFVEGLAQLRGKKIGAKMGRNTVAKHCRHVQPILDLAGPRGPHNRRGLSLLADVPFIDRPRGYKKPPEDAYTLAEAQQIVTACQVARLPRLDGMPAPTWWRGVFLFASYTGLRIGTLLKLDFDWIEGDWLVVPPLGYKRSEPKRFYLNAAARQVIEAITHPVRKRVFPWPHVKGTLYDQCAAIVVASGLPAHRRFRFHGFRKLFATETAELNPLVAQMALGHASMRTTQEHYLASRLQVRTLDQLPKLDPLDDPRQGRLFV